MTWTTTRLNTGPLTTNTFDYTITGLSASTNYKYRAYMIVDGVEYYGNELTGRTCNIILTLPSVTTGGLQSSTLTTTSFSVSNNIITSSGNTSISEYGLLYTQESAWGCNACLTINNNPLHNSIYSGNTSINSIPYEYTANLNDLKSNTNTFYRTYAKNAAGTAYGDIKTQITAALMPNVITGGILHQSYGINNFSISGNTISLLGDTLISEYGLLYTQESSWSDANKLVIDNYPSHVKKYVNNQTINSVPHMYVSNVCQTSSYDCDSIFYRAYVKNACGIVYGDIKTQAPVNYRVVTHLGRPSECDIFIEHSYRIRGSYGIYCCDGTLIHNKIVKDFDYAEKNSFYMPNGCYYIDFNNLILSDSYVDCSCFTNPIHCYIEAVNSSLYCRYSNVKIDSKCINFSNLTDLNPTTILVCLM